MNKHILAALTAVAIPALTGAQTALDAYQASQPDLRGTARFMGMAGAFTALGGDLSTLNQNPGGIGIYRSSDIGVTMDISMQSVKSQSSYMSDTQRQTKVTCPTVGYIGATRLNSSVVPFLQWGFSYGRTASFERAYRGQNPESAGSLTNYVASYTAKENWTPAELNGYASDYNPFQDSYAPWMSILMYNSYGMNPSNDKSTDYEGLYNGTSGGKTFDVVEHGYVDEYNINLGGNIMDLVYWGIGVGITDLDYTNTTYYTESFSHANIVNSTGNGRTTGEGQFGYESWKRISGTGYNFKLGVIVKPINELRIGVAFHSPTYYNLNYEGWAQTSFNYQSGVNGYFPNSSTYGCDDWFSWKLRTPWRMMLGLAGVIGNKAIISLDYEYRPYDNMGVKDNRGNAYTDVEGDIKTYYCAQNIIRAGAEYRLTSNWSLRAGYSFNSSPVTKATADGENMMYTSGPDDTETQPSFTLDNTTHYVTAGIGFRYSFFYADAAYVWRHRSSEWHAYTNYDGNIAPSASLTDNHSDIVLTIGFRF